MIFPNLSQIYGYEIKLISLPSTYILSLSKHSYGKIKDLERKKLIYPQKCHFEILINYTNLFSTTLHTVYYNKVFSEMIYVYKF